MKLKKWFVLLVPAFCFMLGMSGVEAAKINVTKTELGTGTAVKGAHIAIIKLPSEEFNNGTVVKEWDSDGSTLSYETQETGWYIVRETDPAPGYLTSADQKFYLDADSEVNFKLESDYTKAEFEAIDASTNKALSGVKFELRKADGTLVEAWTSDGTVHRINKLPIATYKLKVVGVPDGYQLPGETEVEITELCAVAKLWPVKIPDENTPPTPTPTPGETTPPETIEEVPNTSANASNVVYGLGIMIIAIGGGMIYKHAKQN